MLLRTLGLVSVFALGACADTLESTKRAGPVPDAVVVQISKNGQTYSASEDRFWALKKDIRVTIPRYVHELVQADGQQPSTAFNGYFTVSRVGSTLVLNDRSANQHYVLDPNKYDDVCLADLSDIVKSGGDWSPANEGSDFKPNGVWYGGVGETYEGWQPKMVAITKVTGTILDDVVEGPRADKYSFMIVVRSGCEGTLALDQQATEAE